MSAKALCHVMEMQHVRTHQEHITTATPTPRVQILLVLSIAHVTKDLQGMEHTALVREIIFIAFTFNRALKTKLLNSRRGIFKLMKLGLYFLPQIARPLYRRGIFEDGDFQCNIKDLLTSFALSVRESIS